MRGGKKACSHTGALWVRLMTLALELYYYKNIKSVYKCSHALSRALTRALALQTSALRVLQTACESIERLIATVDFAVGAEVVDRK